MHKSEFALGKFPRALDLLKASLFVLSKPSQNLDSPKCVGAVLLWPEHSY